MMQKVKVVSGLLCGLVGRIVCIDHSWPAPLGIRCGKTIWWFYAEDLETARMQDIITAEQEIRYDSANRRKAD
jgi:hypothetical protein